MYNRKHHRVRIRSHAHDEGTTRVRAVRDTCPPSGHHQGPPGQGHRNGPDVAPYIWYPLCNQFSIRLTPTLCDPSKVYIEHFTFKAEWRLKSSLLRQSMVTAGPLNVLLATFRTPATATTSTVPPSASPQPKGTPRWVKLPLSQFRLCQPNPPPPLPTQCSGPRQPPHSTSREWRGSTHWGDCGWGHIWAKC